MRVPDEVRQSVVFIGVPDPAFPNPPRMSLLGTAFFVSVPASGAHVYMYLVTARHVVRDLQDRDFAIRANLADGGSIVCRIPNAHWWYHPTDDSADVAVIPYVPPDKVAYKHIPLSMFLTDQMIRDKNIGVGDEVFITGLFAHLTGSTRNLPIVRMGNVAMIPDEPVPTPSGTMEGHLIEARSIGGLSGSPAFVRQSVPMGLGRFYLLGLMHGHWDIPPAARNDMIANGAGAVNLGIAIVVPASKIADALNQTELAERRASNTGE